jgi:mRNA interferase HigB
MLREFWQSRAHDAATAERDLKAWYKLAEKADWENFAALKRTFGTADQVGNCVVFDVGNNRYRLIGRVNYVSGKLFVLKVMDHREYDRKDPKNKRQQKWVDECGCNDPPPKRPAVRKPREGN